MSSILKTHEAWCRGKGSGHSDAAKRLSDVYNLHRTALGLDSVGKWFAASLAAGESDGVLYDSKLDCILHQRHNEKYYTFIKIVPSGMSVCEAEVMIVQSRKMYNMGLRMTDPDHRHGGMDLITRLTIEDQMAQMQGIVTNLRMPWEGTQ